MGRSRPGRKPNKVEQMPAAIVDAIAGLGSNIAIARQRRELRQEDLARKAGIPIPTLRNVETGNPGTTIASHVSVLWALGLLDQLRDVARPDLDAEGQALAAARLGERVRPAIDDAF